MPKRIATLAMMLLGCLGGPPAASAVVFNEFETPWGSRTRPSRIHGGSDFGWVQIRWSTFGGISARGSGLFYYVDKSSVPYVRRTWPVRLDLTGVYACFGQRRYREMSTTFSAPPQPWGNRLKETRRFTCPRVYWYGGTSQRYFRPRRVFFGNHWIANTRWYSWGLPVARGRGSYPYNNCIPNCAQGRTTFYPVLVRLSRIDFCQGDLAYGRLTYHFPGRKPPRGPRSLSISVQRACEF